MKEKYLKLLGSKMFPDILESSELPKLVFNRMMVAHVCAVASQCTGIKEGSFYMQYVTSSEERFTKDVMGPKLCFSMYTPDDKLIEHTSRSTRLHRRICNTNDFTYSDFHTPAMFKDFLLKQELKMKHLPGLDWSDVENEKLKIDYKKPKKLSEHTDYFYEKIIRDNQEVEAYINYYLISQQVHNNKVDTKPLKI